ncbi:YncE family protein [Epibacterium ulvae]|uniref:YncE family protein n=1 Tax=Epibacterium ulvae TaxID=1156985 RepID=UPI002491B193|nr:hypothetical protein [Epibacterium ulvae]
MLDRRRFIKGTATTAALTMSMARASKNATAQQVRSPDILLEDRVILTNESSNTLSVIDPNTNLIERTINLTSFDEDPRPPFRFVTRGVVPTHTAMVNKALYHGAITVHGAAPNPDQTMIACTGRGTSNVYLVDTQSLRVIGNRPNPKAGPDTSPDVISSGVLVGREPHEPTFSRSGKELWVALRGENRFAICDVEDAIAEAHGEPIRAVRRYLPTIDGPAQVWFSKDGETAFVISQKVSKIDIFDVNLGSDGYSNPVRRQTIDISEQDPFGFTPFQKVSPDGEEMWISHKIADGISVRRIEGSQELLDHIRFGDGARPNHVEFCENDNGRVVYASFARIDDDGPNGVASSRIAIIDRDAAAGQRRVVGHFFSHGRDSHGIWTNPDATRLYVAHEKDELPGTPNEGQTVTSVFDVTDPFHPQHIAQIPLGSLELPSGQLRNKQSVNLIYLRPGSPLHTG